mmetsp:Transcript_63266/g.164249  ORF Transcript_63266/g.164249 Transcript_63266/m.164249 type:complete len:84 (-) Transcript_63266:1113-1364(-)
MGREASRTERKTLGSKKCRLAMTPFSAVLFRPADTWAGVQEGLLPSSNAAPPETWGHAMEVPLKILEEDGEVIHADTMALPGA